MGVSSSELGGEPPSDAPLCVESFSGAPWSKPSVQVASKRRTKLRRERRLLPLLRSWAVGSCVWSDRTWTYTRMGGFTLEAFQFKAYGAVDRRWARVEVKAPSRQGITVYLLGETKEVDAPWAFSAGAPRLDHDSWNDVCETLPEYEAGASYRWPRYPAKTIQRRHHTGTSASNPVHPSFDWARWCRVPPGGSLRFEGQGGKVDLFVRLFDDAEHGPEPETDVSPSAAEERCGPPAMRQSDAGLRGAGKCQDHQALLAPPEDGWLASESGWATHAACSSTWLRRRAENGSSLFYCLPLKSSWAYLPGRGLVPVDSCLNVLSCMRDAQTTWRQCFQSWKEHVVAVGAWRKRLRVITGEAQESRSEHFELRTAFRKPSLKRSASTSSTPKKVSFASTDEDVESPSAPESVEKRAVCRWSSGCEDDH
ncbi:unnamed protein product [Durusdinium trenchii]|uniref:Uncharacterized protein n=1 Tax=Durusdinium trenchii TaxID=1381693 RepID=A0ABP0RA76_9DINO